MKGKIIFEEEQSFVGTWVWYLILGISAVAFGGAIVGFIMIEESEGIIGLSIAAVSTLGVVVLFYSSKLTLTVDKNNIYYRYPPFVNSERIVQKNDLQELYVRKYHSITEYGGWGYRYSLRNGRAFIFTGDIGLQIVNNKGKKILIGTQKPELLEKAIKQLKENWGMNNG